MKPSIIIVQHFSLCCLLLFTSCGKSREAERVVTPEKTQPGKTLEERLERSVVQIKVGNSWGSGFAIKIGDEIFIATAYHVVMSSGPITVIKSLTAGDKKYYSAFTDAIVEATDARHDIALLSLPSAPPDALVPLEIAPEPAKQGDLVRVAGFPATSFTESSEMGFVLKPPSTEPPKAVIKTVFSDACDPETGQVFEKGGTRMLVVDIGLEPGNSGGPLLNANGEVVGLAVLKDVAHHLQDGAIDAQYLKALVKDVEHRANEHSSVVEDLQMARKSLQEALQGRLSVLSLSSVPVGDVLLQEDRAKLEEILKVLLQIYSLLPEKSDPNSFQNLFFLFWKGEGKAYSRSRMLSYKQIIKECARTISALPQATETLPKILGDILVDCAAMRIFPSFAVDSIEALFIGREVDEVINITLTDRTKKRFRATVRLRPEKEGDEREVVPIDVAFRRGGWRIAVVSADPYSGLSGRYDIPKDSVASKYESICRPRETSSDCILEEKGKKRLSGKDRFIERLSIVQLPLGFKYILEEDAEYFSSTARNPDRFWLWQMIGVAKEGSLSAMSIAQTCSKNASFRYDPGDLELWDMDSAGDLSEDSDWGRFKFHKQ